MRWTDRLKFFFKFGIILSLPVLISLPARSSAIVDASAEKYLLQKINEERAKKELKPLKHPERLRRIARNYSFKMSKTNRIKHISKEGFTPEYRLCKFHIHLLKYAENLAKSSSPALAHRTLMNSKEHRVNILNPDYTHVGIGVVKKGDAYYVTQEFIKPLEIRSIKKIGESLLDRLNRVRENNGLSPLNYSEKLEKYLKSNPPPWDYKNKIQAVELPVKYASGGGYFTLAFTGSDPHKLPGKLTEEVLKDYSTIGIGIWLECLPRSPFWKYKFSVALIRNSPGEH